MKGHVEGTIARNGNSLHESFPFLHEKKLSGQSCCVHESSWYFFLQSLSSLFKTWFILEGSFLPQVRQETREVHMVALFHTLAHCRNDFFYSLKCFSFSCFCHDAFLLQLHCSGHGRGLSLRGRSRTLLPRALRI